VSWLEPLTRSRLFGIVAVAAVASSVTYSIVHSLVIEPLRDRAEQRSVEDRKSSLVAEASDRTFRQRVAVLEKALSDCQLALSGQPVSGKADGAQDQSRSNGSTLQVGGLSQEDSSQNQGSYNYQARVGKLHIWGHGSSEGDELQLILESVSNYPSAALTFFFLAENTEHYAYRVWLSNPNDTTLVLDDLGGEYKLVETEGIRDIAPLEIPAYSRRRFQLVFEPVGFEPKFIKFQALFMAKVYSSLGGQGETRIVIDDIPMSRFKRSPPSDEGS